MLDERRAEPHQPYVPVIFGPPNQLATILALAGASLTVALKYLAVGFFG